MDLGGTIIIYLSTIIITNSIFYIPVEKYRDH